MSLTSYRAAPPRDKPLRALSKTGCRNGIGRRAERAVPIRRLPEKATLGKAFGVAGGMYQRRPALERPMRRLLRILSRSKPAKSQRCAAKTAPARRLLPDVAQKP